MNIKFIILHNRIVDWLCGLIRPIIKVISRFGTYTESNQGDSYDYDLTIGHLHIVSGYSGGYMDTPYATVSISHVGHADTYLYTWDDLMPNPWQWVSRLRGKIFRAYWHMFWIVKKTFQGLHAK